MRYYSTRGGAPPLGFCDAVLTSLAPDGGLYLPEVWPELSADEIAAFGKMSYPDIAHAVMSRFVDGEIPEEKLRAMTREAYATFRHPAVAPLAQLDTNHYLLELFHGPTFAFKDVAMQLLARLMDHALVERGANATIVGATSGDTGGAAIEAFSGRERITIAILFPDGRVSPVQRRQMTTCAEANVKSIAVTGTFDDCQALVKSMFSDTRFRDKLSLSGVNSINWGRIAAQVVYYFSAAVALGAPHRPISFTVPSGNFGNILAGWVARRMGLPVDRLVIATNVNDILHRVIATGRYEKRGVVATRSPSMDIEVSSNFERLLYELEGRDTAAVLRLMSGLEQSGAFTLGPHAHKRLQDMFLSGSCDEAETHDTICQVATETGHMVDPHTAVGIAVAKSQRNRSIPMITLATAHPCKFPDAVESATGIRPELPTWAGELMSRDERYEVLPADLAAIESAVERHAHAPSGELESP